MSQIDLSRGRFFVITTMIQAFFATKGEQSQMFTQDGKRIPVTVVMAGPCWVTRIIEGGSYTSLQLAFGSAKQITKAQEGNMKKAGLDIKPRFLREIRVNEIPETVKVGSELKVADVFAAGDKIMVTGTSKGKGFAGVVKRHGFKGGPRTHGQSDRERAPGSIGQTTTPGRVYRGKRMAGRMGNDRVTVRGLEIVAVDTEKNTLQIKGLVPGSKYGVLLIQKEV
jgi:large subunit ribosomal protein L3